MNDQNGVPKRLLSVTEGIALTVGIVVGVGIFKTPSLVAAKTGTPELFICVWLVGGIISVAGGLCYAELSTAFPGAGGEYHYLFRAFGRRLAFLFGWARMTVIQPGSIAMLAFVMGDYMVQLFPFHSYGSSFFAAAAIAALTFLNLRGTRKAARTQTLLTLLKVIGLVTVIAAGLSFTSTSSPAPLPETEVTFGLAMVFVLLTFGGWNEAVYISAELVDVRRNMIRVLLWGIAIIVVIYLLICIAYLKGIGLADMGKSEVVAADLMRRTVGEGGAKFISFLIALSAMGAVNATIITGARTNYALGCDFPLFSFLGRWNEETSAPRHALILQGAISLGLVLFGTLGRKGFVTMVEYTAPVFWLFFFLAGLSLILLRSRDPGADRPFKVPLYPVTPLLFCATCIYMLQSSLVYTGIGALCGIAVLLVGALVLLIAPSGTGPRGGQKKLCFSLPEERRRR